MLLIMIWVILFHSNWQQNYLKKHVDDYNHYYVEFTDTGKTPKDTVKVFTYQTIINKVDQDGNKLKGADFTLYKDGKEFKPVMWLVQEL